MSDKTKINRKRQAISLETKIKIIDSLHRGVGPTSIGKDFGLNEATVYFFNNNDNTQHTALFLNLTRFLKAVESGTHQHIINLNMCSMSFLTRFPLEGIYRVKKELGVFSYFYPSNMN